MKKIVNRVVTVSAPSRLHFGLYSVGQQDRKFGGIGLMIQDPRHIVEIAETDPGNQMSQPGSTLTAEWIEKWRRGFAGNLLEPFDPNRFHVTIASDSLSHLPRHIGLGSGTQLAFSTAVGLSTFFNQPIPSPGEIAAVMDRAGRSAIGSYGFFQGGFLVDRGINQGEVIAPLDLRLEFPAEWPIVLVLPEHQQGLSGKPETVAFEQIEPTPPAFRQKMIELVRGQIVPALAASDYDSFAEALYEYGYGAGDHFSGIQNGPYNGPVATELVRKIRDLGVAATGQSSWGPCIFAIARDDEQARTLIDALQDDVARGQLDGNFRFLLTRADNSGAITRTRQTATR
ncbi:MAG: hypothetical protein MK108_07985 [Mariniblastus sp.]|nr:hypothetical protein [Mariniblastus sp.]